IDALVLDEITRQNGVLIPTYYHTYIEFSEEQLSILTIEDMSKLEAAYEIYLDLQGIVYEWIPEFNTNTDNFFTYIGDTFINNAGTFNIYGQDLTLAGKLN